MFYNKYLGKIDIFIISCIFSCSIRKSIKNRQRSRCKVVDYKLVADLKRYSKIKKTSSSPNQKTTKVQTSGQVVFRRRKYLKFLIILGRLFRRLQGPVRVLSEVFWFIYLYTVNLKFWKLEEFLNQFDVSNSRMTRLRKSIVTVFQDAQDWKLIEGRFTLLTKTNQSKKVDKLTSNLFSKGKSIFYTEIP